MNKASVQKTEKDEVLEALKALDLKWETKLQGVNDEISKIVRRIEEVNNNVTLIYQDRNILEDIQQSIIALREGTHMTREHQDRAMKDVKAEVIDTKLTMEEKVKDVEKKVENTVEQVTNTVETNLSGIAKAIEKKKVVKVKDSFIKKFFRRR